MKKFLSLVLALAMTMSLVTISAGAKDFTDADDITYVEAVEVMTAIGVVDGDTAGNFNPTAGLTRGAAAKIICNLILGPTTAAALNADANPYKDVDKNSTFAGYIAFCQKEGIISGYADGTFKPAAPLTGYAFMKMLLGALGYDVEVEGYTGSNWSINVAKRAINIGLDDGLTEAFNGSAYVTREEAMLYAFNALQADMVDYDTTITIGDVTVAGSKAEAMVNNTKTDGNIGSKDGIMQFAEKYFTNLKDSSTTDAFERPATEWKIKSESVGVYSDTPDLSYTSSVKVGTIYADLGLSKGIADEDTVVYEDGVNTTSNALTWTGYDIVRGDITNKIGGNGALTEVYYDADANTARIVVVNTYVAEVAAVRPETTTMDAYVQVNPITRPTSINNVYETEGFAKEDIVAYTYSMKTGENCIESMELAEKVTGAMTAYTISGSVTVGSKYDANTKSVGEVVERIGTVDKGDDVVIYLDEFGYVLYVDADAEVQYAVVLNYVANAGDFNDTAKAKLLFTDGTTQTVEVEVPAALTSGNSYDFDTKADSQLSKYDIVSYTVNSDGKYELGLVADSKAGKAGGAFVLTNGIHTYSIVDRNVANVAGAKATHYADGETIFLVADTSNSKSVTYSVYEGFANVPTIKHNDGAAGAVTVFMDSTTNNAPATVIFIEKTANMTMTTDNKDVIFIQGSSTGSSYTTALGNYYEYDAYVNGEAGTVKTTTAVAKDTLVYGPSYNSKGLLVLANCEDYVNADSAKVGGNMAYATATGAVKNDVIKLGAVSYAAVDDVNVYLITVDGKLLPSTLSAIAEDDDDIVYLKTNEDGLLTDVYVQVVDQTTGVNNNTKGVLSSVVLSNNDSGDLQAAITLTKKVTGSNAAIEVVTEKYVGGDVQWLTVATSTIYVCVGDDNYTATVLADAAVTQGATYRVTATLDGASLTSLNFTSI